MNASAQLFEGLTVRRVLAVTAVCAAAAGLVVWFFINTYLDLLVTSLCVGYTSMVLFTVAGNVRQARLPREAMQLLAIIAGSVLGTLLAGALKGRSIPSMFTERLSGVAISMGLGIGFGCVVVATVILREKHARDQARILRAEAERHQLEKNVLEARLALMQAQVEPHFLFNTLANVQHLVETDAAAASRMLASLIKYLRAALPQMREATTTLGREIEMAVAFLDIHRVRMGSRLDFEIRVPESLRTRAFPPMMLISLVENAIKHGVDPCCECGTIVIHAEEIDGRLKVSVTDTGEGIKPKKGGGVGLSNIRERLKALYGGSARLVLEENAPRGVVASIELAGGRAGVTVGAVIADDEPLLRAQLRTRLGRLWPELTVVHEMENGRDVRRVIAEHRPQLFFLDIHMPGVNGLEAAREIGSAAHVVFVTAYDDYAVQAFERGAIDYVLKPFDESRLQLTVDRLKARLAGTPPSLDSLVEQLAGRLGARGPEHLRWIKASVGPNVRLIPVEEVLFFQSDEKYTRVVTLEAESLIRKPIRELLDELDPAKFWQVHRATIVNVDHIASVRRGLKDQAEISLKGSDETLVVSRAFTHLFKQM